MGIVVTTSAEAFSDYDPRASRLLDLGRNLRRRDPGVFEAIAVSLDAVSNDMELLAEVLAAAFPDKRTRAAVALSANQVFEADDRVPRASMVDVAVAANRNMEPGGEISALLFARGVHAILAHRVAHALWSEGRKEMALALKTVFGRAFSTDIHPGAVMGEGIWLDHGLGFVVGETAVIEDGVSIWHGVTLGSTLKDDSATRHPRLRRGCTIGADSIILGDIDIGERSVVAAGAIVLASVPAGSTVAGVPARTKARSAQSFSGFSSPSRDSKVNLSAE